MSRKLSHFLPLSLSARGPLRNQIRNSKGQASHETDSAIVHLRVHRIRSGQMTNFKSESESQKLKPRETIERIIRCTLNPALSRCLVLLVLRPLLAVRQQVEAQNQQDTWAVVDGGEQRDPRRNPPPADLLQLSAAALGCCTGCRTNGRRHCASCTPCTPSPASDDQASRAYFATSGALVEPGGELSTSGLRG